MGQDIRYIVFRTKGNHKQGMGDVMGSLALADAFSGHDILFIVDDDSEAVECVLKHNYKVKAVKTLEEELLYLESFKPDAIIVNQLNNPKEFLQELKKRTDLLVTIDDVGKGASVADLRFNPEYYVPNSYYGPEFVPLREEFQNINKKEKTIKKEVKNILVTLGGSDTYGFTPKVVRGLSNILDDIDITIIIGSTFRHNTQLNEVINNSKRPFRVLKNIDNMAEMMFNSDIGITGGGLTLFEMACVGTPTIVVCGELFEEETANMMQERGFSINLGFGKKLDEKTIFDTVDSLMEDYYRRLQMSKRGKKLVNGRGTERIAEIILEKINEIYK